MDDKFKIFCGTANEPLCDEVCAFLGLTRGQAQVRFDRLFPRLEALRDEVFRRGVELAPGVD